MKNTLIIAAMALTCISFADTSEKKTTTPPATTKATAAATKKANAAEAALIKKFVSLQDAAIETFLELGDTLASVKDKESADAAAPTVKMAGEQLCTIISAVEALGEPSEAVQQAIMSRAANVAEKNSMTKEVMLPMLTLMMQEPPCYGSEALQTELTQLLSRLQGAAGMDEEEVEEATSSSRLREPDADETDGNAPH